MKVITELFLIKKFREEKEELALSCAKAILQEEEIKLDQAKISLRTHLEESKKREEKLYSDLYVRLVQIKDINSVSLDMTLIKERTVLFEDKVKAAMQSLNLAIENVNEAKIKHHHAVKEREKFSELLEFHKNIKLIEDQRLEDLELEEVIPDPNKRIDKNDFDNDVKENIKNAR